MSLPRPLLLLILATAHAAVPAAPAAAPRLTTPWTSTVSQELPWPEYPRPQLVRAEWLNLNGRWDYWGGPSVPDASDPPPSPPTFPDNPETILVPFPAESYLSGIQRVHEQNLWYRRTFLVPETWSGRRVQLHFQAVDRTATVYVNGMRQGTHSGGYDSFGFDITRDLRAGVNEMIVGVHDPTDGVAPVGKQRVNPTGIWYTGSSGIWQTVWLEPTPDVHIGSLELTPDPLHRRVKVVVHVKGGTGEKIEVAAFTGISKVGETWGVPGVPMYCPLSTVHVWSPEDPFLYDLEVKILAGPAPLDHVKSYFGLRTLSLLTQDDVVRPALNDQPIFQVGVLDQGYWPDGLYTAPTDDALKADLLQARALGFNMVRKHVKVEPQRWYHWADRLGVLVWQDMPNVGRRVSANEDGPYGTQLRAVVNQLRNSPAVVAWVPFNEGWGARDVAVMARMVALVRSWDPTRWVDANSGTNLRSGESGAGDFADVHYYPGPQCPPPSTGRVSVLGEFGGLGLKVTGHMWDPNQAHAYAWHNDAEGLTAGYEALVTRAHPLVWGCGLSAVVYTELADIEGELNGLVTYDRRVVKVHAARVKAANEALLGVIHDKLDVDIPQLPHLLPDLPARQPPPLSPMSFAHWLIPGLLFIILGSLWLRRNKSTSSRHHLPSV